jgi:hypothetical protein
MIQINVNVTDDISPMLAEVISSLSGQQASEANEVAGRAALNAAIQYHREFDKAGGWKGKRYLGPGPNDGSSFGADVARGWHFVDSDKDGATIRNEASYYAFKVTGGTITPKRAKNLTIPLIQAAKGLYASVYQQNTGRRLFKPKGKDVLMEKTENGGVRAVYALVKSVTMGPWPGSLPDEDEIADAFTESYLEHIEDIISRS